MRERAGTDSPTGGAQAIRRAVEVVRLVAQIQRSGASLSRVARASGLKTSTAFRILHSLNEERLLRYDQTDRCYYVGPLAYELGLAAAADAHHVNWRDTVDQIARTTRLTTYLVSRADNDSVCLLCVQAQTALRAVPIEVGQRMPLGVGAGSLVILASLGDEEVERVLSAHPTRLAAFPGGKVKPDRILKRIAFARQHGFAMSSGTIAPGVTGIGVAMPPQGLTQLAMSVSAVANSISLPEAEKIAAILATAIRSRSSRSPEFA